MANVINIVRDADNKLWTTRNAACKEYDDSIMVAWNKHSNIHNIDDELTREISYAIKEQQDSGGKTFIVGYVQTVLRNENYIPIPEVTELYESLKVIDQKNDDTCKAASKEFESVVTLEILCEYHRLKHKNRTDIPDDEDTSL